MNKYERLFNEILEDTKNGKLKWKLVSKRSNADIIFNPYLVFRQFSSQLIRDDTEYELLLVEKKFVDPDDDFFLLDRYALELLILEQDELVTCMTESVIERKDMLKLVDLVETKSDKAKKLFSQPRISELLEKLQR